MMTVDEFIASIDSATEPPSQLAEEMKALWHSRAGNWDAAHNIAQDIQTPMGSWIHAHLHVIEGDLANAGYWYRNAGRRAIQPDQLDTDFRELVEANLTT